MSDRKSPQIVRPGLRTANDAELPEIPQPPNIRYVDRYVAARLPVWFRCAILVALGLVLGGLVDVATRDYRRDHGPLAWRPRPDLKPPLQLTCDPSCSAPQYCDSATGRCVMDAAAIAIDPSTRRSGTAEYP
jgi:hypothetical protein